jgi:hypothetical protein
VGFVEMYAVDTCTPNLERVSAAGFVVTSVTPSSSSSLFNDAFSASQTI